MEIPIDPGNSDNLGSSSPPNEAGNQIGTSIRPIQMGLRHQPLSYLGIIEKAMTRYNDSWLEARNKVNDNRFNYMDPPFQVDPISTNYLTSAPRENFDYSFGIEERSYELFQQSKTYLKTLLQRKVTGNEPQGVLFFLELVIHTATKNKLRDQDIFQLLKAGSKQGSPFRKIVLDDIELETSWPDTILKLSRTFPDKLYERGRMPYSTALDEYCNYEGWSKPPMARTTSTLELLLSIHQLARSLTLAAGDPNIGESTYQRVRDKILSLIPTLIDSVFLAERQAKHLGGDKLEALFNNILTHHVKEIDRFMLYN